MQQDDSAPGRWLADVPGVRDAQHVDSSAGETHKARVEAAANTDVREAVSRAMVEQGFGVLGLSTIDLSLEDIFVELVTKEETE